MLGDYVDAPSSPLYPFGHGLSYTTFDYAALEVGDATTAAPFTVSVRVTQRRRTRRHRGRAVLPARRGRARRSRPRKQLAGFARVDLEPGAPRIVEFTIDPTQLAYYDEDMRLVIEPGTVRVMVGPLSGLATMAGPEREIAPNDRRPSTVVVRD